MAKDPSFPFYAQDFLVDTIRWTREMQGLHVSLMAESWANGGLPDEGGKPMGLGSTDVQVWFKIKHKWELVDGMWINKKIEEVRAERKAFIAKQREKGILSGKRRNQKQTTVKPDTQPKTNTGSTVVEPIEDEEEIEDEKKNKKEPISKLEIFEALFSDDLYVEQLSMTHKGKDLKQAFEECYTHHGNAPNPPTEIWEWKQKLNTWLTIKRHERTDKKSSIKITPEGTLQRHRNYGK